MFSLNGKFALVTGGSHGIGLAITKAFLEHGAKVLITARNEDNLRNVCEELAKVYGDRILYRACDVSDFTATASLMKELEDQGVNLDILVNNAGKFMASPIENMDMEKVREVFDTNVMGLYAICKAALPLMKQNGGRVINISSIAASRGRSGNNFYATSKAAVSHITRGLAIEWAQYGILVNAIAPGMLATEFNSGIVNNKPLYSYFTSRIPMGRFGKPEEIAPCALFLASDENSFMTGEVVTIDGGHLITL